MGPQDDTKPSVAPEYGDLPLTLAENGGKFLLMRTEANPENHIRSSCDLTRI
ncbi:hypothetical protein WG66_013550 [Moniliophthora roreri]|nr:hypothetical protein WG66_013550 [Moniliophthora roreri]